MHYFKKIYHFILPGIFPFTMCFFLLLFSIIYHIFNLPSPLELSHIIERWFNQYGLWLLFFAALVEGLFVIGMYFPGSLSIALAVYTLGKTTLDLFYIGSIAYSAFLIANILNYYLGRYGYYRFLLLINGRNTIDKMQSTMLKHGNWTFFLTGFFPNFIAITSVCAGISKMSIFKTITFQVTSLLFWVTVWTIIGSFVIKRVNLQDNNQSFYILTVIFLWGVFLVFKEYIKSKKQ